MLKREARISGDPDFPNWMSFGEGLTYYETARQMGNWYYQFNKQRTLPKSLDVYVRDVGGKTQFFHTVSLRLQIDVIPASGDVEHEYSGMTCVICHDAMPMDWDYAACEKCAKSFEYDFEEDDRNFDAANGR